MTISDLWQIALTLFVTVWMVVVVILPRLLAKPPDTDKKKGEAPGHRQEKEEG